MKSAKVWGALFQGLILGLMLLFALWKVVMTETGARIFRYQGF